MAWPFTDVTSVKMAMFSFDVSCPFHNRTHKTRMFVSVIDAWSRVDIAMNYVLTSVKFAFKNKIFYVPPHLEVQCWGPVVAAASRPIRKGWKYTGPSAGRSQQVGQLMLQISAYIAPVSRPSKKNDPVSCWHSLNKTES
jgi:hypothetical protein